MTKDEEIESLKALLSEARKLLIAVRHSTVMMSPNHSLLVIDAFLAKTAPGVDSSQD